MRTDIGAKELQRLELDRLRAILDAMEDGVYIVNREYDIEYINPAIEKEFGPVNGHKCHQYFHDRQEMCPWCKNRDVMSGKSVRWEWHSFKTGKTYDLFDTPIRNADGSISKLEFFHDITDRKDIERRTNGVNALLDLFVKKVSRREYLDSAVDLIRGLTGCSCVGIRVLDKQGYIPYESYVGFSSVFLESECWLSVKKHECICPRVILEEPVPHDAKFMTSGGSFFCNDTINFLPDLLDAEKTEYRGTCMKIGFRSMGIVPVRYGDKVFGAIHIADKREGKLPIKAVELIESLTPLIGEAIYRFGVEEELHRNYNIQAVLNAILGLSMEDSPLDEFLKTVLEQILALPCFAFEGKGAIFLVEDDANVLVMKAQEGLNETIQKSCEKIPFGRCLCGIAASSGEMQFADHCDERHHIHYEGMTPHGHYCVPVLSGSRVLGVISIYLKEGHTRDRGEEEFLTAVANTLAGIITRKQAEDALRKSEAGLANAQRIAHIGNWEWNIEKNDLYWSDEIYRIFGLLPREFGATYEAFLNSVHPGDREFVKESVNKALYGNAPYSIDHRILLPDVSERIVHEQAEVIFDGSGRAVQMNGTVQDITERKNLEGQLRHAQKMEAVGQLAGGIAHDFNNALTAIIGFGKLLIAKRGEDDLIKNYMERILGAAQSSANLVQGILAFSRKQAITPQVIDINELVKNVERILLRLIGEDIELNADLSSEGLAVKADSALIEQVMMNLATNARDAMPDGGSLTITTEVAMLGNEYVLSDGYGKPGSYAVISFADTGLGMDEDTMKRIFEPFFTTKDVGKGTGLGLAMAYGIIKQHEGFINVYSEPGKGTTFKICLPLIDPVAEGKELKEDQASAGGTETILLAEDDDRVREVTRTLLEDSGYKVIAAENGEDAVDKFRDNIENVQLIICDMKMPKKGGLETYEEIKKIRPEVKFIFMSGYVSGNAGGIPKGIDFIQKPVYPDVFLIKVREVMDR